MLEYCQKILKNKINIGRPKDIPVCVPDCGWNHGENKTIVGVKINSEIILLTEGLKLLALGENLPSIPNIPFSTMGGKIFWNELANVNGWRVQENQITHYCRILNPENIRVAWDSYHTIIKTFERLVKK
jgi:hypothetical protein